MSLYVDVKKFPSENVDFYVTLDRIQKTIAFAEAMLFIWSGSKVPLLAEGGGVGGQTFGVLINAFTINVIHYLNVSKSIRGSLLVMFSVQWCGEPEQIL